MRDPEQPQDRFAVPGHGVEVAHRSGPAFFDQGIKGAQHSGLAAPITKHSEAPGGFVVIDSSQLRGCGDKRGDLPTESMCLLLIAGQHVG